mmetsp:Transcript_2399/g.3932  ORF Transcript_2399/g.3932 Transcript_2399/m.3932 type:complete len:101 (+) Transcript_2399:402-704(+)
MEVDHDLSDQECWPHRDKPGRAKKEFLNRVVSKLFSHYVLRLCNVYAADAGGDWTLCLFGPIDEGVVDPLFVLYSATDKARQRDGQQSLDTTASWTTNGR